MKYVFLIPILLALALPCSARDLSTEVGFRQFLGEKTQEAIGLHQEGEYDQAITIYTMLLDLPGMRAYENARAGIQYNLVCAYSLSGQKAEALAALGSAVEMGFADREFLEQDPDLESLRGEPHYLKIMAAVRAQEGFWSSPSLQTEYRDDISIDEKTAGLARLWSEIKYNFAFFHQVPDLDWDSLFVAYLPRVRKTRSTLEYYRMLEEMCAHLKDGHTGVTPPRELWDSLWAKPPIRTGLIEDRVLIMDVFDEDLRTEGIVPGVEVLSIDGIPVRQYAEEHVLPYQCASSPQGLAERTYNYSLLSGPATREAELTLEDAGGEVFTRSLVRTRRPAARPVLEARMLTDSVAYVALSSFGTEEVVSRFDSVFTSIANAAALIIDLRENQGGNSGFGYQILGRLTADPFTTTAWRSRRYIPTFRAWGIPPSWYRPAQTQYQPGVDTPFSEPVVVLTGPQTASAAEDFCVAFTSFDRGTVIGQPTYGSTGQPLVFRLPGGGSAKVCTKHDTYLDGRDYVGIGILPDIVVSPTVADIRAGRDPVLDQAVAHLAGTGDRSGGLPAGDEYLLLRLCEGVVRLYEREAERVWPGYSLAEQPFLVYVPDRWGLLFNPDGPVEGFGPCPEDWPELGSDVLYHEGKYDDLVGQLVFDLDLDGITTLAIGFPAAFSERIENPEVRAFAYIVHEAFHQYQNAAFGEISWAREEKYPISDLKNGALAWLEMRLLEEALDAAGADDAERCRERAKEFVAIRNDRWASGDSFIRKYEQGKELKEGTAKYVELRSIEIMSGLHYVSSLDGFPDPLAAFFPETATPELLLQEIRERMGESCLEPQDIPRNRIYAVAAAEAFLLDYFGIPWKGLAEQAGPEFAYVELLLEYLGVGEDDLSGLAERAKRNHDYESVLKATVDAAQKYRLAYAGELETFEGQAGSRIELIIPTSNLSRSRVSTAKKWIVDDGRFLYCSNFKVYTLRGGDWSLEVEDAGLLEINDWDAGVKTVVLCDPGVDSVSLGGKAETLAEGAREFEALELEGDRFVFKGTEPGRFTVAGDTVRVDLVQD